MEERGIKRDTRLTIEFILGERGFTQVPDAVGSWSLNRKRGRLGGIKVGLEKWERAHFCLYFLDHLQHLVMLKQHN